MPQKLVAISTLCTLCLRRIAFKKMRHKTIDRSEYNISSAVELTIVKL